MTDRQPRGRGRRAGGRIAPQSEGRVAVTQTEFRNPEDRYVAIFGVAIAAGAVAYDLSGEGAFDALLGSD